MDFEALLSSKLFDELPDITDLLQRPAWHAQAACRDVKVDFFPGQGEDLEPAKAVCRRCPLAVECAGWAVEHREQGVWGGLSARDRRGCATPAAPPNPQ